jgi:hypothetical protein
MMASRALSLVSTARRIPKRANGITGGDAMSDEQLLVADRGSAGPTDKLLRRAVTPLPDEED